MFSLVKVSLFRLCTQKVRKVTHFFAYMQEKNAVCGIWGLKTACSLLHQLTTLREQAIHDNHEDIFKVQR